MVCMQLLWGLILFLPLQGVQHTLIPSSMIKKNRVTYSGDMNWAQDTVVDFTISSWILYDFAPTENYSTFRIFSDTIIKVQWLDGFPLKVVEQYTVILTASGSNPIYGAWFYLTVGVAQNLVLCAVMFRGSQGKFSASAATTFTVNNNLMYMFGDLISSKPYWVRKM